MNSRENIRSYPVAHRSEKPINYRQRGGGGDNDTKKKSLYVVKAPVIGRSGGANGPTKAAPTKTCL